MPPPCQCRCLIGDRVRWRSFEKPSPRGTLAQGQVVGPAGLDGEVLGPEYRQQYRDPADMNVAGFAALEPPVVECDGPALSEQPGAPFARASRYQQLASQPGR